MAPPAPTFVPAEEFKQFQATITGSLGAMKEMMEGMRAMATSRTVEPPAAPPAVTPDVSITDIQRAFEENPAKGAELIVQKINAATERLRREHIDPLQTHGLAALSTLAKSVGEGRMPRYPRFKKEIDAALADLDPVYKTNPEVFRRIHDSVVGANVDALIKESVEEALRKAAEPPPAQEPGRVTGRTEPGKPTVPSVGDLMGKEYVETLAGRGLDADAFAKRIGYKDWADYCARTEGYWKQGVANA